MIGIVASRRAFAGNARPRMKECMGIDKAESQVSIFGIALGETYLGVIARAKGADRE